MDSMCDTPKFLIEQVRPLDTIEIVRSCIHYIRCPETAICKEVKPIQPKIDWEQTFLLTFVGDPIRLSLTAARELHEKLGNALSGCEINPKAGNLSIDEIMEKWGMES